MANEVIPELASTVQKILAEMQQQGFPMQITSGHRTAEKQNELFKQGKTPADGFKKPSRHQFGAAVDVGFTDPTKANWDLLGQTARKHGLQWGGDWNTPDRVHLQMAQAPTGGAFEIEGMPGVFNDDAGAFEIEQPFGDPPPTGGTPGGGFMGAQARQAAIPEPPKEYSIGGFAANALTSGANVVKDTFSGLWNLGSGAVDMAMNPTSIPSKVKSGIEAIPSVAEGIKNYATSRYGSGQQILDTLYEDPFGAALDASTVTGIGALGKIPGAAKLSRATNVAAPMTGGVVKGTARATGMVTRPVGSLMSRVGARGRNEKFLQKTVNPKNLPTDDAGTVVKESILNEQKRTFSGLQAEYDRLLAGPLGSAQQPYISTKTTTIPSKRRSMPGITITRQSVEPGKPFKQLHEEKGELLKRGRQTQDPDKRAEYLKQSTKITDEMKKAASRSGLTKEAQQYFDTGKEYSAQSRRFGNKFVQKILNTPDEALAGFFEGGRFPTYSKTLTKSNLAGGKAKTLSNKQLIDELEGIVGTKGMDKLRASVGERIRTKVTDTTGDISGAKIESILDRMDQAGLTEKLIPNHKTLRDITKVLEEHSKMAVLTGPGLSTVRHVVYIILRKAKLHQPDIERAIRRLNGAKHPVADKVAAILSKTSLAAAQSERIAENIPNPPTEP